jgi:ribosomal protein S18 acetylase RimI-like enzyme
MAENEMRWHGVTRGRLDYVVQTLRDPLQIREILRPRVEYTAYALGQLEPSLFGRTRWHRASGDTGQALVLHSQGGLGEATFVMGDPDAVLAILSVYPGPVQTYITCQPQHLAALRSVYRIANQQPMIRMAVTAESFRPVYTSPAVILKGTDVRRINSLYSSEGGPSFYVPDHIDAGIYRGVVVDGRLAAIAGTHVVSRQEGVAVVGNVFTHPAYRGKGYATMATSAVTQVLLSFCDHVVLTVDPSNRPAVHAYQRLGYREVCQLVEATAGRRDLIGLTPHIRRLRAAMRGRRYGGLFVSRDR